MSPSTDINVISLLVNDDFINYAINPTLILKEMWDDFFGTHPDLLPIANEAKEILFCELDFQSLSPTEIKDLEKNIFEKCGLEYAN